jgi:hypothetical protein
MGQRARAVGLLVAVVACGGKAIIDGNGSGGGGGTGGTGPGPAPGQGGSGLLCYTDPPVGSLFECTTGMTTSTGSGAPACQTAVCDEDGQIWISDCQAQGCRCYFNGQLRCTCNIQGGEACSPGVPACCPEPFPP